MIRHLQAALALLVVRTPCIIICAQGDLREVLLLFASERLIISALFQMDRKDRKLRHGDSTGRIQLEMPLSATFTSYEMNGNA